MNPEELGFEENFHNTNYSSNRGTISYSKSNHKKFKLCVTPTPQSQQSDEIKTFFPSEGRENSWGQRKTEKSKSVHNVHEMGLNELKTSYEAGSYLSVFNENYEDLISTIKNTHSQSSTANVLRQSAPFGKLQFSPNNESQAHTKIRSSIVNTEISISKNISDPINILVSQVEDEIKGLTNTEEISNFYEYTEDCMKSILKLVVTPIEDITDYMISLPFEDKINAGEKRLAIFDLDETLVHCQLQNPKQAQQTIPVKLPSKVVAQVGLNVRPHWKEALDEIKKNYFIIVYTASHQSYADSVLDYLDPDHKYFEYRLYRNNCVRVKLENELIYVKDLRILKNISLKDVIIIDNSVLSFAFQLENGIPIMPYYDSKEDVELVFLAYFLKAVATSPDLRVENQAKIRLEYFLQKAKEEEEADEDEDVEEIENTSSLSNSHFPIDLKSNECDSKQHLTLNLLSANDDEKSVHKSVNSSNQSIENDKDKPVTIAKSEQKIIRPRLHRQSTLQNELKNILYDLKKQFDS